MSLFSWHRAKPEPDISSELGVSQYTPLLNEYASVVSTSFFKRLIFPPPLRTDAFGKLQYEKQIVEFAKHVAEHPWVDVCLARDMRKICGLGEPKDAYAIEAMDKLACMHCVKYKNIPPEILQELPDIYNAAMNTGTIKDVDAEVLSPVVGELAYFTTS